MKPLLIVAFLDGRPGHEKQTRGVLAALEKLTAVNVAYRNIGLCSLWGAVRSRAAYLYASLSKSDRPGPCARRTARSRTPGKGPAGELPVDLIIGAGSAVHLPMLFFKQKTGAKTVTCMAPDFSLVREMDLCLVPRHDRLKSGPNVFFTTGPPCLPAPDGEHDPGKGLILAGGIDKKSHVWRTQTLLSQVQTIFRKTSGINWTLSSSPRTPEDTAAGLERLTSQNENVTFFRSEETRPGWVEKAYAQSDMVWVTADSISMVFEALSAGCRVGILPVQWKRRSNKFQRSVEDLIEKKMVMSYKGWISGNARLPVAGQFNEAHRCAKEILRRWWPERLP
ncbi:MAG: ELM1/GtrOC1 family putative glycosyltransferase [Desulfobacterales bacterium]|nr:ELM1/GtrOC1 family putative glycosyltransferase [Desulfobacterales bacterium]